MKNKSGSAAPKSARAAGKQPTDVKFNMKPAGGGKPMPGSKDMGIPPFTQKARNVQKLSTIAKDCKRMKGSDKYS